MSKYHAIRTEVDGIVFASKKEANRYQELKMLERAGEIRKLEIQVKYPIVVNNAKICHYIADFRYIDCRFGNQVIVEDTKGVKTPVYKLKAKLMKAIYGMDILET